MSRRYCAGGSAVGAAGPWLWWLTNIREGQWTLMATTKPSAKKTKRVAPEVKTPKAVKPARVEAPTAKVAAPIVKAGAPKSKPAVMGVAAPADVDPAAAAAAKPKSPIAPVINVDEFIRKLKHPMKPELEAVRAIILAASPKIAEGIKWNAPSFRVTEYFATMNLRSEGVMVVLHQGAKATAHSAGGLNIADPTRLLQWLAKDRAAVKFVDMSAIKAGRAAFTKIIRQWIAQLP